MSGGTPVQGPEREKYVYRTQEGKSTVKNCIKQQIKKRYPQLVSAYHEYRNKQLYKGFKAKRSPFGFDFIGSEAMQDGTFEPVETSIIKSELAHSDVFIDIGANVGYFVCLSKSLRKKTIAVEPLADNLNYLYANLKLNGWEDVEVFPVGLAEKPGLADLYGGTTAASLLSGWAGNSEIWKRTIPLSTLDIILGQRFVGQQIFIKIDVEGAEYEVLKGASIPLTMTPKPTWLLEICLTELHPEGLNPNFKSIFELYWKNGYQAVSVGENSRVVTPEDVQRWVVNRTRDFGYVSYLFKEGV